MKRFGKWMNLIGKQKCRQLYFWILLAFFLVLLSAWQIQSNEPMEGVTVSVYLESIPTNPSDLMKGDGEEVAKKGAVEWTTEERTRQIQLQQLVREKLSEESADTLFHVILESDRDVCRDKVAKNQAECGFLIPYDIGVRILDNDATCSITVYQSPVSSMTSIVQEKIYAVLFEVYAGEIFARYVADTPELAADETEAWEAYRNRLGDGSTFHFTYEMVEIEKGENGLMQDDDAWTFVSRQEKSPLPGVPALYGFMLYLMLWIGLLDCNKERERCRYYFNGQPVAGFLGMSVQMLFPVGMAILMGLFWGICHRLLQSITKKAGMDTLLLMTGHTGGAAFLHILGYVFILWGYGLLVRALLPKRQWLTAAMPVLLLATLVFSPVIIDLAAYVPALKALQNCFPLTWWIR